MNNYLNFNYVDTVDLQTFIIHDINKVILTNFKLFLTFYDLFTILTLTTTTTTNLNLNK